MAGKNLTPTMMKIRLCILLWVLLICGCVARSCNGRRYNDESVVCVCNATYCDDGVISPQNLLSAPDSYLHYVSSASGKRLSRVHPSEFLHERVTVSPYDEAVATFLIDTTTKYQEIFGFGAAITDSAGINIASLSKRTQMMLIRQYFGEEGSGYSFIRLPIGGTDFSTRNYTYDDVVNDTTLSHFQLQEEDYKYKIPYIKLAQSTSSRPVRIITAPWSCPEWMKELRFPMRGHSRLQKQFYQLYADYILKFLDEYKAQGIQVWGISSQNEPHDGVYIYYGFNSLGWEPGELIPWIRDYFGPTLHARGYSDIKILMLDDYRKMAYIWAVQTLSDELVHKLVSGIAFHWYSDNGVLSPASLLSDIHSMFPDKFLIYTEASFMHSPFRDAVILGNWERGELYAHNVIEDLNNWVVGWIDWNMVLDMNGGPTWVGNTLDAAIIVNATADEFYKQPTFYTLAHFSKFIPPGTMRIKLKTTSDDDRGIENIAFLRPDNYIVVVLMNRDNIYKQAVITDKDRGEMLVNIPAHSIHTLLYKNKMSPASQKSSYDDISSANKITSSILTLNLVITSLILSIFVTIQYVQLIHFHIVI